MNSAALHPRPRWGAAFLAEVAAVGISLRRELIGAALLVAGVTPLIYLLRSGGGWTAPIRVDPDEWGFILAVVAFIAPLAIWKSEGPARRDYFWSLPLPRGPHTLSRVLSGWGWLMVVILAVFAWLTVLAWVTGGGFGLDQSRLVLGPDAPPGATPAALAAAGGGALDPALFRQIRWTTPGWLWLVPVVAPTIAYLLGSIAALRSDHPWLWLAAPGMALMVVGLVGEVASVPGLAELVLQFAEGRYGLETLITGSNEATTRVATTGGEEVLVWRNLPAPRQWLTTVLIWGVPAVAGVLLAAFRHQER
jgi:hypothetical protein